jgi:hypothetical protein
MSNTINAAANPALANNLLNKAMAQPEVTPAEVQIISPSDTTVILPGGYITPAGEVVTQAEVRELNGMDEEAIAKASNIGKAILTILQRGTVRVGNERADDNMLDKLLAGDRDALILGIFKATFGREVDMATLCSGCSEFKTIKVNLDTDIKVKILTDPLNDRVFKVRGRKHEFTVQLPTGITQKELILNAEKTSAELNTLLLENTVLEINGSPVLSKLQVQSLGVVDRRTLSEEINKRLPGPQFEDVKVTCPDCDGEVSVSVNFGTLFRL